MASGCEEQCSYATFHAPPWWFPLSDNLRGEHTCSTTWTSTKNQVENHLRIRLKSKIFIIWAFYWHAWTTKFKTCSYLSFDDSSLQWWLLQRDLYIRQWTGRSMVLMRWSSMIHTLPRLFAEPHFTSYLIRFSESFLDITGLSPITYLLHYSIP